jgi:alpha-L-rhamnosidase
MIPEERLSDDHLHWLMVIGDYYHCTGDISLIRELFPAVKQILEQIHEQKERDGLLESDGQAIASLNSLCVGALRNVAGIAEVVGDHTTSERCREKAEVIEAAMTHYLWDEEQGLFRDTPDENRISHYANALAIIFEIAPRDRWGRMLLQMFNEKISDTLHAMTPSDIFYLIGALYHNRNDLLALNLIRRYWGADGLFGEKEESWVPSYYFSAEVLGVQAEQPGYRIARIAPWSAGLSSAEGYLPTRYGVIEVRWEKGGNDREFTLEAELPWKVGGLLGIPRLRMKYPRIIMNGEIVWSNEKLHPNEQTVTVIADYDRVWFEVMRGRSYRVEAEG